MNKEFKYDVAFSFTQQDERIAYEINDLIQDQYKTFIYSQHQDILAGSDGETIFSEVFSEQARIVIVLYRSSWGESRWTRVEKDAIQNRSRDNGYGFCIFIPLDDDMSMPPWIPTNYIYYNLNRFGVSELVPVIKHKIHEASLFVISVRIIAFSNISFSVRSNSVNKLEYASIKPYTPSGFSSLR